MVVSHHERFLGAVQEIIEYRQTHGYLPTEWGEAAYLGEWLRRARAAAKGAPGMRWTPGRQRLLDRELPGWDQVPTLSDRRFHQMLDRLVQHLTAYGDWPTRDTDAGLVQWLTRSRAAHRGKGRRRWSAERSAALNRVAAGWDDPYEAVFLLRARQVAAHRAAHGALPTASTARELANWLTRARAEQARTPGTPQARRRRRHLDRLIPEWAETIEDRFATNAHQVAAFVAEHGRFPTRTTDASLSEWLIGVRRAASGKGNRKLTPKRRALLDDLIPGWAEPPPSARNRKALA